MTVKEDLHKGFIEAKRLAYSNEAFNGVKETHLMLIPIAQALDNIQEDIKILKARSH